jgi:hypothetical protein
MIPSLTGTRVRYHRLIFSIIMLFDAEEAHVQATIPMVVVAIVSCQDLAAATRPRSQHLERVKVRREGSLCVVDLPGVFAYCRSGVVVSECQSLDYTMSTLQHQ